MVVGNGYGEDGGGPIIEQTSSSLSHYEIMALVRLLAAGLGVDLDDVPSMLALDDSTPDLPDEDRRRRPAARRPGGPRPRHPVFPG